MDDLVQKLRARSQANGKMFPDAMVDAAADRIEELTKYKSLHAGCDKVSLDIEQKLVNQLAAAHKRIKELEAALREIKSWNDNQDKRSLKIAAVIDDALAGGKKE